MKQSILRVLFAFMLIINALQIFAQNPSNMTIIGYYPNWQWYDRSKLVNPLTIQYSKYSILNYSFFKPNTDGTIVSTDSWADENLLKGQINWSTTPTSYYPNTNIVDKCHSAGKLILASVGGWTLSDNFPQIAASATLRAKFASQCKSLCSSYNLDGIDIDWEYPGYTVHLGTAADKANFPLLLKAIRDTLTPYGISKNKTMKLTACFGASASNMNNIDWPNTTQYLDYVNLMSYDFFGSWDPNNNHNSPLYAPAQGDPSFNIDAAVTALINTYGVPANKITAGLAFYGRSTKTTAAPALFGPHTGLTDKATFYEDEGTPLYYNFVKNQNLFNTYYDAQAQSPYALGKNGLNTFLSYDDKKSIGTKAQYIKNKGLAGCIIWEITGDYIENPIGTIQSTPLIDTLNTVFGNNIVTPIVCVAPTGLATTPSTTSVVINWSGAASDSFNLQYKLNSSTTWSTISNIKSNTYTLTKLLACTAYNIQLQKKCSNTLQSPYSAIVNFTTIGCPPACAVPTTLAANNSTNSTIFTWSNTGATSYNLQYKLASAATWTTVSGLTTPNFSLSKLPNCTVYNWKVNSVCGTTASAYTSSTNFTSQGCANCATPTGLSAAPNSNNAVINWTTTGAKNYILQWKLSTATTWNTVSNILLDTYTIDGLTACTSYDVNIMANCITQNSAVSTSVTFKTTGCVAPCNTPTALTATPSTNGAAISWVGTGATSYSLKWKLKSATTWNTINNITSTIYTIPNLATCTDYDCTIAANCGTVASATSVITSFKTTGCVAPCNTPTALAATPTANNALINWANTGATSYTFKWKISTATTWNTVSNISTNTYTIPNLTACTDYDCTIAANCGTVTSATSSMSSFKTTGCSTLCATPNGLWATPSITSATLSWIGTAGVTYNVQYKLLSASIWTTVPNITTATYVLNNLTQCADYQYNVTAVCSATNQSSASANYAFKTTGCGTNTNCSPPTTYNFTAANYIPLGEIKIGQGRLYPVWGTSVDAHFPTNRVKWAIANAHAAHYFRNVLGTDKIPANFYFATAAKESFNGCDNAIVAAPANTQFPFTYQAAALGDGCFQIENLSAYTELNHQFPQRFPVGGHKALIADNHYITASLSKAYYDIFAVKYWEVAKGYRPIEFFNNATDPSAAVKLMAVAYNRGLWYSPLDTVLYHKRTASLASNTISPYFINNAYGYDYQNALTNYCNVLDNKANLLPTNLTANNPASNQPYNSFSNYYDPQISWSTMNEYMDSLVVMYPTSNWTTIKQTVQTKFNSVNNSSTISFRYQLGQVLDALILQLPVDDPTSNIASNYGCISPIVPSLGATCAAPTTLNNSVTNTASTLTWSGTSSTYNLQYKISSASAWTTVSNVTSPYNLLNLSTCVAYDWKIQGVCATNTSAYISGTSFTTTGCVTPCNDPSLLSFSVTNTASTLTWSGTSASYNLQYKLGTATTWTTVSNVTSPYNLSNLAACSAYNWQIQGVCATNTSAYVVGANFNTSGCVSPCNDPSLLSFSVTNTASTLTWSGTSTSYNLQYKLGTATTWTTIQNVTSPYNLSNLAACSAYNWQIQGVCATNTSAYVAGANFNTSGCVTPCNDPSLLSFSVTNTASTLTWSGTSASYNLQYKLGTAATWTTVSNVTSPYNLSNLASCSAYNWQIQGVCATNTSAYVAGANFNTSGCVIPCAAPTTLNSSVTNTASTLTWSGTSSSYNLQYKLGTATTWTTISNVTSPYNLSNLTACSAYNWQIQGVCATNTSAYVAGTNFTTTGCTGGTGAAPNNYCSSFSLNSANEWIEKFTANSFSNISGNNSGFGNFMNQSFNITAGQTMTFTFQSGFLNNVAQTEYWSIWSDWNRDGDFEDAGEQICTQITTTNALVTKTITVPSVISGGYIRFRVSMKRGIAPSICDVYSNGEVEDYNPLLIPLSPNPMSGQQVNVELYPNPVADLFNVQIQSPIDQTLSVSLIDINGRVLRNQDLDVQQGINVATFDNLQNFPSGVYLISIQGQDNLILQKRWIKE